MSQTKEKGKMTPNTNIMKYRPYIMWRIGHYPKGNDVELVTEFLLKLNASIIREDLVSKHFRLKGDNTLHIIMHKKNYGITINAHKDLNFHGDVIYEKDVSLMLHKIRNFLSGKYGNAILIKSKHLS